jgi:fatty-acyl-CoA synthase
MTYLYKETMQVLFEQAFAKYKERVAVKFQNESYTYDEISKMANRCSYAMADLEIGPDEKSALVMSNCTEFIIADVAIMKAGSAKVPLNDMLGEKDIFYILKDSGAKIAFVGRNFFDTILEMKDDLPDLKYIVGIADPDECPDEFIPWLEFISNRSEDNPEQKASVEDMYLLAYTGGTTGLPKGVVHSQRNGYMNLCSHLIETEMSEKERLLVSTPLPHSAGLFAQTGLLRGATIVIEKSFDPVRTLELIEKEKITFTFMVPTMIYRVLDQLKDKNYDVSSLSTILYGAAPITAERLKQGLAVFGPVFLQFFGQTECPNFITRLSKEDHTVDPEKVHRLRSCGRTVVMANVQIVDSEGRKLSNGEEGEIVVSSSYVMNDYYQIPDKTAETIVDGWLHTGDIGKMDEDGYVYLLDRKKDMIISGGLNIYTTEVENLIQKHPGVRQVAVIGAPHKDWGEVVTALIIPEDHAVSKEEISQFCSKHLSKYKRPKQIEFKKDFPLTPYGKLDKKELRKPYWDGVYRQVN